jgi:hypothetical protein
MQAKSKVLHFRPDWTALYLSLSLLSFDLFYMNSMFEIEVSIQIGFHYGSTIGEDDY